MADDADMGSRSGVKNQRSEGDDADKHLTLNAATQLEAAARHLETKRDSLLLSSSESVSSNSGARPMGEYFREGNSPKPQVSPEDHDGQGVESEHDAEMVPADQEHCVPDTQHDQ
ncbi:unnamed protein product, partial [Amoebophrya sp. A25]|eukprot:GSA25T00001426001.1